MGRRQDRAEARLKARSHGGEIEGKTKRGEIEGEIKRQDRAARYCGRRGAINAMRLARSGACNRRTGARGSPVMSKA